MGLAPRQRVVFSTQESRISLPWCLSHFRDGPTDLVMVREKGREKGDRHRDISLPGDSKAFGTEPVPFLACVFTLSYLPMATRERS